MTKTNSEGFAFSTFSGKKVLVTGHTGFKGSWLTLWLEQIGAKVVGFGLEPATSPSLFNITKGSDRLKDIRGDIRNQESVRNWINIEQPDFVFHLAAQSLVRKSYNDAAYTWETNLMGTVNVLEALKQLNKKCVAVFITSDKCYKTTKFFEYIFLFYFYEFIFHYHRHCFIEVAKEFCFLRRFCFCEDARCF